MQLFLALSLILFTSPLNSLPLPAALSSILPRIGGTGAGSTGAAGTMGMYAGFTPPYIPTASTSPSGTVDSMPSFASSTVAPVQTGGSNDLVPRMIEAVTRHLDERELPPGPSGQRGADGPNGVASPESSIPSPPPAVQQVQASPAVQTVPQPGNPGGHVGPVDGMSSTGFIQEG